MVTAAYKRILGIRTLLADLDLGVGPVGPTPLYTDSKSVADGQACERIDKNSRWMATRYAMVRWGIECGTIDLRLIAGSENCADIFTKALVGALFYKHRRTVLGMAPLAMGEEELGERGGSAVVASSEAERSAHSDC
jgi:hypothetical protein